MKASRATNVISYILGMAFNLAILAIVAYAVWWFAMWGYNRGNDFASEMLYLGESYEFTFVLEEDTPRAEAALLLYEAGAINNPWLFRLEMFLKNSTRMFRAGTYTLNTNMTNTEVNATLRRGQTAEAAGHEVIRILEGWTIDDMDYYFSEEGLGFFERGEFIYYTINGDFSSFRFLRDVPSHPVRNPLEGYLFPDTYWVPLNPTPRQIITRMLDHFESTMEGAWIYRAEELGFTLDEIITMASVIEGETGHPDERTLVSQVIHRRLREGMLLQMDATAIYTQDVYRGHVLHAHLQLDTPFNTHIHLGLPIGPIGNPGLASIEAALFPSNTNYLFFVVDYRDHTRHVFTATYPEHNRYVQLFHASR